MGQGHVQICFTSPFRWSKRSAFGAVGSAASLRWRGCLGYRQYPWTRPLTSLRYGGRFAHASPALTIWKRGCYERKDEREDVTCEALHCCLRCPALDSRKAKTSSPPPEKSKSDRICRTQTPTSPRRAKPQATKPTEPSQKTLRTPSAENVEQERVSARTYRRKEPGKPPLARRRGDVMEGGEGKKCAGAKGTHADHHPSFAAAAPRATS